MANLHELHLTLQKACRTAGITVDEAFQRVGTPVPLTDEMAEMSATTWMRLCDLLCLCPDHALYGYDESLHRNLINYKRNTNPERKGFRGTHESSYRGRQPSSWRSDRINSEDGRI